MKKREMKEKESSCYILKNKYRFYIVPTYGDAMNAVLNQWADLYNIWNVKLNDVWYYIS